MPDTGRKDDSPISHPPCHETARKNLTAITSVKLTAFIAISLILFKSAQPSNSAIGGPIGTNTPASGRFPWQRDRRHLTRKDAGTACHVKEAFVNSKPTEAAEIKRSRSCSPEQPLDVLKFQFHVGRPTMVALARVRGRLHLTKQRIHVIRAHSSAGAH